MGARVIGWGAAVPEKVLTNDDLTDMMDTSDEWIQERTGIRERRVGGVTSTLSIEAGRKALDHAGVEPDDIGLLILCTTSPDQRIPGTSAVVHAELGLSCGAFDLNAACAGFTYGYVTATTLIDAPGGPERILLIGTDVLASLTDFSDRGTGILFGDGGGAVVLERTDEPTLLGWDLGADGGLRSILYCDHDDLMKMEGREVFRQAVRAVTTSIDTALANAGLSVDDIDVFIPHQANLRIVESVAKRLGLPMEKAVNIIHDTGNTSAGSIPLAIAAAGDDGRLERGKLVCMSGFGAGMAWATIVVRW